ncbi:unnamed protein product [Arctia plantaginis]|uniref:Uncharacterized protein n=1 Tax=Arctia plantaginis TaxID=874455 RepID=A0A8S1A781_ARCPL|nr:unnamed protein product [Arctia plantaginis]
MRIQQEEKEHSTMPTPQSELQSQHDVLEEMSSDDSMKSLEDSDESYIPPKGIHLEQEQQRNITLRPRRHNKLEANFTELEIPNTYVEEMNSPNSQQWKKAVVEELQSHEENQTWWSSKKEKTYKSNPLKNSPNFKRESLFSLKIEKKY